MFCVVHCLTMPSQCLVLIRGCSAGNASAQVERGHKKARAHPAASWQHIKYLFTLVGLTETEHVDIPIRMSHVSAIKHN